MNNSYTNKIKFAATSEWLTVREAVNILNNDGKKQISESDLYRGALHGKINLSIYFQSPLITRKIKMKNNKLKLTVIDESFTKKLCFLDKFGFLLDKKLIYSTEGEFFYPTQRIFDTPLFGNDYVAVQRLLALSLNIPLPSRGGKAFNYGLTIKIGDSLFQIFEKTTWQDRICAQYKLLPENFKSRIDDGYFAGKKPHSSLEMTFFPVHYMPQDSSFVIRVDEIERLIMLINGKQNFSQPQTRISTPLSRLFWLACKNNDTISPLIKNPYKLLTIFERWAVDSGITDRLSADTLKTALKRGSPF